VQAACYSLREQLFNHARGIDGSPLANADLAHVVFTNGRIALASDPGRFVTLADALKAAGVNQLSVEETVGPNTLTTMRYAPYTHSAIFVEARVDEELGVVRVTRIVNAVAAGKILNPKTAASQVIGGVVMGLGMALQEEGLVDHRLGRVMNHNLGEYHVPVNADIREIDVIFVEEHDDKVSPLGVKGLGEIGIVGTAAAIGNAIYHATGKRIRNLPITMDKLLG
jgi:xanthine dehydrogenase YagR molybdenum-binding subunit